MKLRLLITTLFLAIAGMTTYSQINSVGIIGSATPGGWDADTEMTQDPGNPNIWTLSVTLTSGEMKFRANNSWEINWGGLDFPAGIGEQDGPDISVREGEYNIIFNTETGDYLFDFDGEIGIIGSAVQFGWDRDVYMIADEADPDLFTVTLNLVTGQAKFRADGSWELNWGGPDFPSGTATVDGPDIPVASTGRYKISFNRSSLEYSFEEIATYSSIGLTGSATPGGNEEVTPLIKNSGDPSLWEGVFEFSDGGAQFVSDEESNVQWGGTDFPSGIAITDGPEIPVTAGRYAVTFNTSSGEYNFAEVIPFESISIIGTGTEFGNFDQDVFMNQSPNNEFVWTLRAFLTDGEIKFRANSDWQFNWGAGDFPSGTAFLDGPNIPVSTGEYRITFNTLTGAYSFEELIEFAAMALVGKSGPFLEWPGDDDSRDTYMTKDPEDGNIWTLNSVTLIDYDAASDGGVKFRADGSWTNNWGAEEFPSGIAVPSGPNIQPVAGTYSVFFNVATGEYAFGEPVSSREAILNPASVRLFPNPAQDMVTIDLNMSEISGTVQVKVFNMNGQNVLTRTLDAQTTIRLSTATLLNGNYFVQISNEKFFVGKKMQILK